MGFEKKSPKEAVEWYDGEVFDIQVISSGSFTDREGGKSYLVETATIRLSPAALLAYWDARPSFDRDDYETGQAYAEAIASFGERKAAFHKKVAAAIGFEVQERTGTGGFFVAQIVSEIFAVAYIHEVDQQKSPGGSRETEEREYIV